LSFARPDDLADVDRWLLSIGRRPEGTNNVPGATLHRARRRSKGKTEMAVLKKGARITGAERTKLAAELKKAYDKGTSIRELADKHGRSYGFVHRVLTESGVTLRGRGGATRTKGAAGKAKARSK
jgi:Helix-turn-helix domain